MQKFADSVVKLLQWRRRGPLFNYSVPTTRAVDRNAAVASCWKHNAPV